MPQTLEDKAFVFFTIARPGLSRLFVIACRIHELMNAHTLHTFTQMLSLKMIMNLRYHSRKCIQIVSLKNMELIKGDTND